jgi:predicted Zn-dependent peptidase
MRHRLLRRDLSAHYLSGSLEERRGALALKLFCLTNNAVMTQRAERAIASEFERLRTSPVSVDELARARHQFKMDYLRRVSTRLGRALFLVESAFAGRPLDGLGDDLENCLRIGPASLISLANRHLLSRNKVILEIEPR